MINKLHLNNFKCFPKESISFREMTVLTGANAAGKSSIIQSLLLFSDTFSSFDGNIDVSKALGISVGGPQALVSQNKIDIGKADFSIGIVDNKDGKVSIDYLINKLSPLKVGYEKKGEFNNQVFYLNAERIGPRLSYPAGIDENILKDGSNAAYLMDRADLENRKIATELALLGSASKFSIHVESWMNTILDDITFSTSTDYAKGTTDIVYGNSAIDKMVFPTMTGFGISYILSIVVAGLWCSTIENSILIIENPEAHLHPYSQSQMGKFLELLANAGVQVVVETHSEHIIDGIRIQAAYTKSTEKVIVNYLSCDDSGVKIQEINVNSDGELSKWPKRFFDQKTQDLRTLFMLRSKNGNK